MTHALLISLYDLGHQPYELLQLDAALTKAGAESSIIDLSITDVSILNTYENEVTHAVIAVPMHTAARLSLSVMDLISRWKVVPNITLMGHYAEALSSFTLPKEVRTFAAGEAIDRIVDSILGDDAPTVTAGEESTPTHINTTRTSLRLKGIDAPLNRQKLPPLSKYTSYINGETMEIAGYVEASRGCLHLCTHCPVAATYKGRIRINSETSVLREIENLHAMGARHITFGDPDFFNAPIHSIKVLEEASKSLPDLTFDATIKVSHILKYKELVPRLSQNNTSFIVSAFEHTSAAVLEALEKGHSVSDMVEALNIVRSTGIEIRPSLLPFTPWTTLDSLVELLDFVADNDLIESIDPVMYSIRLLVPSSSITFNRYPELFTEGEDRGLNLEWKSQSPVLDELQLEISNIAEASQTLSNLHTFEKIYSVVSSAAKRPPRSIFFNSERNVPRLTESWYCCAEPTTSMTSAVSSVQKRSSCEK